MKTAPEIDKSIELQAYRETLGDDFIDSITNMTTTELKEYVIYTVDELNAVRLVIAMREATQ